ncbi:GNAT family N-acetyltransferase [Pyxidicoccus xibeiensis]|uniref:GNAT family N-acetyltransferase n=1 Tax=Pyxidicoccus xibeiensis TaxID=2906759 RepID=UPI0020A81B3F|nr:GNAT family N-acetyltransferase [Pyxidicoccus xibeiensis]MCP3143634.1 GNAT family N-acetyltransferase [Pyxidicoccus xibeiensis]
MERTYRVDAVRGRAELEQILVLQKQNLKQELSSEEMSAQGFVTVQHDLTALEQMHALAPSIVAHHGDALAGYALTMPKECRALMPVLVPMFDLFDTLDYRGRPFNDYRYYVMGQICIDKAHRGQGLFEQLYEKHRELYQGRFDFIATEVSVRNLRSMRAHERVGFRTVHTFRDATDEWAVVVWDWTQPRLNGG